MPPLPIERTWRSALPCAPFAAPPQLREESVKVEETERAIVKLTVNGQPRTVEVEARWLLSDVLRQQLGLTGTHVGCEHGVCGCCTVRVNGRPARSCLLFAIQLEGAQIETVE